jgi:heterotetrameric sarcosine oxidase gamma subunit
VSDTASVGRPVPGHYGAIASGELTLREATIAVAWNVQGDPARPALADAAQRLFGVALPAAPNTAVRGDTWAALWQGPASWLAVAARGSPQPLPFAPARAALNDADGAVFDVSVARVGWTIAGPRAATVLAKGCPLDFHPRTARRSGAGACVCQRERPALAARSREPLAIAEANPERTQPTRCRHSWCVEAVVRARPDADRCRPPDRMEPRAIRC